MNRAIVIFFCCMHLFVQGMWQLQPEIQFFKDKLLWQKVDIEINEMIIEFSKDEQAVSQAKKENEELKKSNEELEYIIKTGYRS